MIEVYKGKDLFEKIKNISMRKYMKYIDNFASFEYTSKDINFEKEIITIHLEDTINKRKYGRYKTIIRNCIQQVCESFGMHKRENAKMNFDDKSISLSFIDEIHFIGILYIENIKSVSKTKMYEHSESIKSQSEEDIIKEYKIMKEINSLIPFIPIEDNNINVNTWWMRTENNFPSQSFDSKKSYIELMGLFVKKEHLICICNENLKKTFNGLKSFDSWFSSDNEKKFIELIVLHEIGHSVFQYVGFYPSVDLIKNETRANYFSSLITHGNYDDKIYLLTIFQPFIYKFPYLSFQFMNNKYFSKTEYSKLLKDYYRMVGVLYGDI